MPNSPTITVIISDLHIGGGTSDPGDDHVGQTETGDGEIPLVALLDWLAGHEKSGRIELFINGDFLEMAQVHPEFYSGTDPARWWSSETESRDRLKAILAGHPDIFAALRRFQDAGNIITLAAGNHDVDIYWLEVQTLLRAAIGPNLRFELGKVWYERHGRRLHIAHGHMDDPANTFQNWENPIQKPDPEVPSLDVPRIEMCPGTLFMLKVVNPLEADYPFVDNIKPITALGRLLWNKSKSEYAAVAWLLVKFATLHPGHTMGISSDDTATYYKRLKANTKRGSSGSNSPMFETIRAIAADVRGQVVDGQPVPATIDDAAVDKILQSETSLFEFMRDALAKPGSGQESGLKRLKRLVPKSGSTMGIVQAGTSDERKELQETAKQHAKMSGSCEVIVTGHTHQPDRAYFSFTGGRTVRYFNPGSWTRYADLKGQVSWTMEMLQDETKFPYQLNYVWVEEEGDEKPLKSEMRIFRPEPDRHWTESGQ